MKIKELLQRSWDFFKRHRHRIPDLEQTVRGTRYTGLLFGGPVQHEMSNVQSKIEDIHRTHESQEHTLQTLTMQLAANNVELARLRMALEEYERRMAELKRQTERLAMWVKVFGLFLVVLLAALLAAAIHLIRMHG